MNAISPSPEAEAGGAIVNGLSVDVEEWRDELPQIE